MYNICTNKLNSFDILNNHALKITGMSRRVSINCLSETVSSFNILNILELLLVLGLMANNSLLLI